MCESNKIFQEFSDDTPSLKFVSDHQITCFKKVTTKKWKRSYQFISFHASAQRASSLLYLFNHRCAASAVSVIYPHPGGWGYFFLLPGPEGHILLTKNNKLLLKYFSQFYWLLYISKLQKTECKFKKKTLLYFLWKNYLLQSKKRSDPVWLCCFKNVIHVALIYALLTIKTLTKVLRHLQHLTLWIFWAHQKRKQVDLESYF